MIVKMASINRFIQKSSVALQGISSLRAICAHKVLSHNSTLDLSRQMDSGDRTRLQTRFYTGDSNNSKVLSQSTLIAQDGTCIEELPILIKRATRDSFPFSSHTYSGEMIREESEFDATFCQVLQNCYSVNEVFKLLEVPSDKVRGFSAAFALQRLHVLKYLNTDWDQIHSFIRSAVMRELYDTVQRDVVLLSNGTLISLVECYLAAEGFSPSCMDAINVEIQSRLGDCRFTIEELLTLANILKASKGLRSKHSPFDISPKSAPVSIVSENASRFLSSDDNDQQSSKAEHFDRFSAKMNPELREELQSKCIELMDNVWVHIASRYPDINEQTLPLVLQSLPADKKYIVTLLEKPMTRLWSEISAEGVGICSNNLTRLRVYSTHLMTYLGRWAYVNIHKMTPPLLLSFLNTFIQFSFLDENLLKVTERCLQLKGMEVQTDVIAMSVEYCRSCRYLSPLVLDAAASHFTQYGYSYEPLQLFATLRAFGQLNYLPAQPTAFLKKAEKCLWDRFDHLQETHVLEILGSFTFLNVLPKNFYGRVVSEYFYNKVGRLKHPHKATALMWLKVMKHAMALDISRNPAKNLKWVIDRRSKWSVYLYLDSHKVAIQMVKSAFDDVLGQNYYHVLPFYGCCAVYLDKDDIPLPLMKTEAGRPQPQGEIHKKLVLLLRSADHFIVNTKGLLGAQVQRMNHLKSLGFIPIEARAGEFAYHERHSHHKSSELLKSYLSPHMNIEKASRICKRNASLEVDTPPANGDNRRSLQFSAYDYEADFSSDDEDDTFKPLSSSNSKKDLGVSVDDSGLLGDSRSRTDNDDDDDNNDKDPK